MMLMLARYISMSQTLNALIYSLTHMRIAKSFASKLLKMGNDEQVPL